MKKTILITLAFLSLGAGMYAYDYTDDIYYNPKKTSTTTKKENSGKASNYVDFSTMSVDEYNMRGQYYASPVDTIGLYMESEPDFVYTTQIQKYYNPTIVTDNADVLQEVLDNSYGNIEIVYNYNGAPSFVPANYYVWNWPYYSWAYSPWYTPWSWSFNFGPVSFGWNSWWNWGGPSWAWGPGWGWGPSWGWGPGWGWAWNRPGPPPGGPGWGPGSRPIATYSPGGRAPFGGQMAGGGMHGGGGGNYNGNHGGGGGVPGGGMASNSNRRPANTTIQHGNNISSTTQQPSFSSTGRRNNSTVSGNTSLTRPSGNATRPATGTAITTPSTSYPSGNTVSRPSTSTTSRPSGSTATNPSVSTNTSNGRNSTVKSGNPSKSTSTSTSRPTTSSPNRTTVNNGGSRGSFNSGGRMGGGSSGRSGGGGGGRSGGRR